MLLAQLNCLAKKAQPAMLFAAREIAVCAGWEGVARGGFCTPEKAMQFPIILENRNFIFKNKERLHRGLSCGLSYWPNTASSLHPTSSRVWGRAHPIHLCSAHGLSGRTVQSSGGPERGRAPTVDKLASNQPTWSL